MRWFGWMFFIITFVGVFGLGYCVSEAIKPPLPDVGPVEVIASYDEDLGTLFCFDEGSFDNLGDLLIAMGKQFQDYEE